MINDPLWVQGRRPPEQLWSKRYASDEQIEFENAEFKEYLRLCKEYEDYPDSLYEPRAGEISHALSCWRHWWMRGKTDQWLSPHRYFYISSDHPED